MEGGVRLRLLFEDRHLLNKSQKSEGLKRTWLLLKPQHKTISDLTSYLTHIFHLENTCPNGPLLSMDGFVLPPFESTHILKDKDLICVKKKSGVLSDFNEAGDCTNNLEMDAFVEKQPINTGVNLLANEEFNAEIGGYQSESEDDHEDEESEDVLHVENTVGSKKRKASKKLQSSKKKKKKCTTTQICPGAPQAVENDVHVEQIRSSHHNRVVVQKSLFKKKKPSDVKGKLCKASIPEIDERNICESTSSAKRRKGNKHSTPEICLEAPDDVENDVHVEQIESSHQNGVLTQKCVLRKKKSFVVKGKSNKESNPKLDERNNHLCQSMPSAERSQLQENGEGDVDVSDMPDGSKKFPSRSARRKKGKRQWLRERAIIEKRELQQRQSPEKDDQQPPPKNNQQSLKSDNLITSTKHQQSDQNSGAEEDVVPIVIRPGHIRFEPLSEDEAVRITQVPMENFQWNGTTSKKKGQKWGMEKGAYSKWNGYKDSNHEYAKENFTANDPIDFDKLMPYTGIPKKGDIIAYRLIELSASWCPEISSFRVGKISWYGAKSNKIVLVPVPKYPISFEKNYDDEASGLQPDTTLYKEDGTLETEFSALIDVRIVKHGHVNSVAADEENGRVDAIPVRDQAAVSDKEKSASIPENGEVSAWDVISQALSEKKSELTRENGWGKNENSDRSSWSYKRGSALGPVVARLREQNEL